MGIITSFLYQMVFTVGVIIAFGLLIALCRRAFCHIAGNNGIRVLLITGAVGTPIHELSHALMCVIFGHKINEIKLYQPNSYDGTLGYVYHSYNPKNIYHQIGNFFIGVAPILGGSGVLLLLMRLLVPDVFRDVQADIKFIELLSTDFDISSFTGYIELFWDIFCDIFSFNNAGSFGWWVFIILAIMISSHMELSTADIKGGLKGLGYIAGIILVMDIVLFIVSRSALQAVTNAMSVFALSMTSFLTISGVFSGVLILIALIIKGIGKLMNR